MQAFELSTSGWPMGANRLKVELKGVAEKVLLKSVNVVVFASESPIIMVPEIVKTFPHNVEHYTQGLEFYQGKLFEGTGQFGQSILAEIDVQTGQTMRSVDLPGDYFGEGITILNDEVFQLTWTSKTCFVYDVNTFVMKRQFSYDGEGWGLANDGKQLIMSNGTSEIVFRNPQTFDITGRIQVFSDQQEFRGLNELEFVDGYIYANVYLKDFILKIDPKNGRALALIDAADLIATGKGKTGEVINGVAFNSIDQLFYITGKNWEKMFAVRLREKVGV
jgi:glutamine cyclotransferase